MGQNIKTCVSCKHYRGGAYDGPECAIAWTVQPHTNIVTGREVFGINRYCEMERQPHFGCGPKGRMWQAHDAREPRKLERNIVRVLKWIF